MKFAINCRRIGIDPHKVVSGMNIHALRKEGIVLLDTQLSNQGHYEWLECQKERQQYTRDDRNQFCQFGNHHNDAI